MEIRHTKIYKAGKRIRKNWYGSQTVISVIRHRTEKGKKSTEYAYFISDLPVEKGAIFFNKYIRAHRGIENSLHYVKDVSQKEDASKIRTGNQPQNISILKSACLNIFRDFGYKNMAEAIRFVSHNIPLMNKLILA